MRLLITGGTGFIGSAVVRELVVRGDSVVCLVRPSGDRRRLEGLAIELAAGDVRDPASVRAAMTGCDATIHLAAPSSWDGDAPALMRDVIEGGTQHVIDAALEIPGHRVVFVSSAAAIGASHTPRIFDETAPFAIRSTALRYAHAKHRAEVRAARAFAQGLAIVTVNPAEVYGPGDIALNTAGNLVDFVRSNPVLVCHGGTSIVHVDDVVAGILAALERGRAGERYILGGDNLTIRQLAELTLRLAGRRTRVRTMPNVAVRVVASAAVALKLPLPFNPHVVPYATRYWFMDNAKARRELGVTFRDARAVIGPTLGWLRESNHI